MKAKHSNTRVSVSVPLDGATADEAVRLADTLSRVAAEDAAENRPPQAPALARRVQELEAKAAESAVTFTFEGIGRTAYTRMLEEHRSGEATEDGVPYGPGFPPALMAASCVSPAELRGNVAEWTEIYDTWSRGQNQFLWDATIKANNGVTEAPKSLTASVILGMNASAQN
jgi:hypothetical protein